MRRTATRIAIASAVLVIVAIGLVSVLASSMGRELLRHDLEMRLSKLLRGDLGIGRLEYDKIDVPERQ